VSNQAVNSTHANEAKPVRVAVCTSAGDKVDQHFSKSAFFDIYDVVNDSITFIERRKNAEPACGCNDKHETEIFVKIIANIIDCKYVLAVKIGGGAIGHLIDYGIRATITSDPVPEALNKLVESGKLKRIPFRKEAKL